MRLGSESNLNTEASKGFNDTSSSRSSSTDSSSSKSINSSPLLSTPSKNDKSTWDSKNHWDTPASVEKKSWSKSNDHLENTVGFISIDPEVQRKSTAALPRESSETHQLGYIDHTKNSKVKTVRVVTDNRTDEFKGASSAARVWILVPKNSDGELKALNESDANKLKGSTFAVIRDGKRVELTGRITVMTEEEKQEVKEKVDLIYEQVMLSSKEKGLDKEVKEGDKKSYSNNNSERTPSEMQFLKIINELGARERKAIDSRGVIAEENKIDEHKREEKREFDKTMNKILNVSMERNFAAKEENQNEVDTSIQFNKSNQAEVDDTKEGTPLKRQGMVDDGSPNPPARRARPTRLGGPAH